MTGDLAFFSLGQLADPSQHRAYNEWHQLDHRPENLALPGVAWGDRWGRTEDCKAQSTAVDRFAGVDYTAMYWFRSPVAESVAAWDHLGESTFQVGRGPLIPGVSRPLLAFFRPVKGYAAASALVSPDVLPYRPNRGVQLTLTEFAEPHSLATHEQHTWEDRVLMPALLDEPGVAGAWTFSLQELQKHSTLAFDEQQEAAPGSLRVRLVYLDGYGDPVETASRLAAKERALGGSPEAGTELFQSAARTIIPWQDW